MSRATILLFDIDGTLVTTAGLGRRAVEQTFGRLYGRADACDHVRFDGMTDRLLARIGLENIGVPVTEAAVVGWLDAYAEDLAAVMASADLSRYRVHAGVWDVLQWARARGMGLGLGTGNTRAGARLKLERVSLHEQFAFGGFGCDAEARVELVRAGARRGAEHLGVRLEDCRVVVIGDTPKDVEAALGAGAECLGVGTGSFTAEDLRKSGATYAFDDLTAPGVLEALSR